MATDPSGNNPPVEDLSPLGQAALDYAAVGYAVFLLAPGTKVPLIAKADGGKGCLDATTDPKQIRAWWTKYKNANIGIATGEISRITVVDEDIKPWEGKQGDVTLAQLERENGKLPTTLTQKTWSGGLHLVFDYVPGVGNSAGQLGKDLDVRNDGGYVVAPPSFVAEDGRSGTYEWVDVAVLPAEMPAWLQAKLKWKKKPEAQAPPAADAPIPKGVRDVTLHAMARSMRARGFTQTEVEVALLVVNEKRCVPPYTDAEIMKRVETWFRQPDTDEFSKSKRKRAEAAGDQQAEEAAEEASTLRLPERGMVGLARDFADLYGSVMETPRAFLYVGYLTYLGASVARKVTLDTELRPQPRLYTVLLGESASTRKSTAMDVVKRHFTHPTVGGDRDALAAGAWEADILHGVGSAEGLAVKLAKNPMILLQFDELKQFVDKSRAEGSVSLPMVNTLFEGTDYDNVTKTKPIRLRNCALSLFSACTTETYASIFTSAFFDIGFLNRLFIVVDRADRRVAMPGNVPEAEADALRVRTRDLLRRVEAAYRENGSFPVRLKLTPEAKVLYGRWYAARTGSIFEKRLETYAMRLMILLAITTADPAVPIADVEVTAEAVEAVLALVDYQLEARRECDPVDAENAVARCEETIRRAVAKTPRSKRELKRACHVDRVGLWVFNQARDHMTSEGEIRYNQTLGKYERAG